LEFVNKNTEPEEGGKSNNNEAFFFDAVEDKNKRTTLHEEIKKGYGASVASETINADKRIRVIRKTR